MTKERLAALLEYLDIGTAGLSRLLAIREQTIRRQLAGARIIPPPLAAGLEELAALVRRIREGRPEQD